mmetsp:Transcript_70867/g.142672  ORF Transcript_70867/g.142672 Transcript_70867/m.142672 type:complete len:201 (-) Transcript_70867:370-972(-)
MAAFSHHMQAPTRRQMQCETSTLATQLKTPLFSFTRLKWANWRPPGVSRFPSTSRPTRLRVTFKKCSPQFLLFWKRNLRASRRTRKAKRKRGCLKTRERLAFEDSSVNLLLHPSAIGSVTTSVRVLLSPLQDSMPLKFSSSCGRRLRPRLLLLFLASTANPLFSVSAKSSVDRWHASFNFQTPGVANTRYFPDGPTLPCI